MWVFVALSVLFSFFIAFFTPSSVCADDGTPYWCMPTPTVTVTPPWGQVPTIVPYIPATPTPQGTPYYTPTPTSPPTPTPTPAVLHYRFSSGDVWTYVTDRRVSWSCVDGQGNTVPVDARPGGYYASVIVCDVDIYGKGTSNLYGITAKFSVLFAASSGAPYYVHVAYVDEPYGHPGYLGQVSPVLVDANTYVDYIWGAPPRGVAGGRLRIAYCASYAESYDCASHLGGASSGGECVEPPDPSELVEQLAVEYVGSECYTILPSVSLTIPASWLNPQPMQLGIEGLTVCVEYYAVSGSLMGVSYSMLISFLAIAGAVSLAYSMLQS